MKIMVVRIDNNESKIGDTIMVGIPHVTINSKIEIDIYRMDSIRIYGFMDFGKGYCLQVRMCQLQLIDSDLTGPGVYRMSTEIRESMENAMISFFKERNVEGCRDENMRELPPTKRESLGLIFLGMCEAYDGLSRYQEFPDISVNAFIPAQHKGALEQFLRGIDVAQDLGDFEKRGAPTLFYHSFGSKTIAITIAREHLDLLGVSKLIEMAGSQKINTQPSPIFMP